MKKRRLVNSGYSGGGANMNDSVLKTWQPAHYSAVEDNDRHLQTLRDRAYDLATNNAIGAAAINSELLGVLGGGLKVNPRIKFQELGLNAEKAREWSRRVKLEFEMWASNTDCDFYKRNNFYELQRIALMSYLTDGDCFCVIRRHYPTAAMPYTLRCQLIEAGRVSNPSGGLGRVEMVLANKHRIINGVEIDKRGRICAVWISNRIWNEPASVRPELSWQRVRFYGEETGCRNVLHICYDTRAEQYRGVPLLAPVIRQLKQVSRYGDAELASAIIKSYFSLFFIQPTSNFDFNDILPEEKDEPVVDIRDYRLGVGTISALPRGVDVKAIDRSNAQSTFTPFTDAFIKQIGAALGISDQVLTKKFDASYSASRAALLLAEEEFKQRRQAFIADFCQPIYEQFLIEAVGSGRIEAAGFFEDAVKRRCWLESSWRGTAMPHIDPLKEVNAAAKRIELGLTTREQEASALGNDFFNNAYDLREEAAMLSE